MVKVRLQTYKRELLLADANLANVLVNAFNWLTEL